MPNVVGLWSSDQDASSVHQTLTRQMRRVRIPGAPYTEHVDVGCGFGVALLDHGILENGSQPVRTEDGRALLMLDGELYNADELKRRFRHELPQTPLLAPELCLRLIVKHGVDILRHLNGLFCLVLYDRHRRRLTLASDRYGFRPLFYVQRRQTFIFGTELKALSVADPNARAIDEVAALEYFCYGSQVIDRTSIQDYWRLPPATILTVDDNGLQAQRYWTYQYNESAPTLDQSTYVTVSGALLDRAVERNMQGSHRVGLFLSGGYDSRAIAGAIRKHHMPVPAFTFGHPTSRDVRFAAMLAARLGFDHYPLTDDEPYLAPYCRAIIWRTEGLCSFANTTSIRYHALFKTKMDIILLGLLGEYSGSHTWPQLLLARSRQSAINAIFDRMLSGRHQAQRLFTRRFFNRVFEAVRERFDHSFASICNEHPLNIADCWDYIYLKPFSTYQPPSIDRHLFEIRAPHMDAELTDFLLTIPPYARLEQRVYKKMIAYRFPEIRNVPCTNSGLPINPRFVDEYVKMALRYAARKTAAPIRKMLRRPQPLGRELRNMDDDFRSEPELAEQILLPLLRQGVYPADMFDHQGIKTIIDEHYQQNAQHHHMLSLLISWGLAIKYLVYGDLSDVPDNLYDA